jgi:hypothetical protein
VGSWAYPFNPTTGKPEAVPGTSSKCNCSTVCLPITPITVTATIKKGCTTGSITPGPVDFSTTPPTPNDCDAGAEGLQAATYSVQINATVSVGESIVDQICDTAYGTIVDDNVVDAQNNRIFPACAAGSQSSSITSTTCTAGASTTNGVYTCTFTAPAIGELTSVSDQVSASLRAQQNISSKTTTAKSNQVTVHSSDAPSTATVTKNFIANEAACVTVRYGVDVHNTSGADETLSLSGLNDSPFGSITSVHDDVLGTTCGVASGSVGLGTFVGVCTNGTCTAGNVGAVCATNLSCNVNGAGAFSPTPVTLAVDDHAQGGADEYSCQFDARFCGPITSISDGHGGTCSGISHTDTVSATLALEDTGTGASLTETDHGVTVDECISGTGVSTN